VLDERGAGAVLNPLSSTMPPLPDPRQATRAGYDAVAGCGPLQRHVDDPGRHGARRGVDEEPARPCRPRVAHGPQAKASRTPSDAGACSMAAGTSTSDGDAGTGGDDTATTAVSTRITV
jgi:hypothetical protein